MKANKKLVCLLTLLLAVVLCLGLSGCDKKTAEPDPSPDASTAPAATADPAAAATPETPSESASPTPSATPTAEPVTVKLQLDGADTTALSYMTGAVFQLTAVSSDGSTGGVWASGDDGIATVDANGVVSCWKAGSVKISYTLGEVKAECALTVTEPTVKILFGGVVKGDLTLSAAWGFEIQLTSQVSPEGSAVEWTVDDQSVATVDQTGLVKARKAGTTTVRCKCGTASASCIIRVQGTPPGGDTGTDAVSTPDPNDKTPRVVITYSGVPNGDFTVNIDQSYDMDYILYNIAEGTAVTWSMEDATIASVDANGVVKGLKEGTTKLICTCGEVKCETIVRVPKKA